MNINFVPGMGDDDDSADEDDKEATKEEPSSRRPLIEEMASVDSPPWTSDSDPDSPPSPVRPDHGNGFTTDTDSDSTIRLVY